MKQTLAAELPPIETILEPLEMHVGNKEETITLSDFDYTLCNSYTFNPVTNNHLPHINPEVVEAARDHNLLVATGRRANTAAISLLWESGLVSLEMPVIAENGGTLVERKADGELRYNDLVAPEDLMALSELQSDIPKLLPDLPDGQELIFKIGRTMLLARLQDKDGNIEPIHQAWLTSELKKIIPAEELNIVDTRVSVSIQHKSVSKGAAFLHYLETKGLSREDIFVIGMGDGANDEELFAQSNLRIGFSSAVEEMVDVTIPHGAEAMSDVLRAISIGIQSRKINTEGAIIQ